MAANLEAACDICSNPVNSPDGYLLVTRQVVQSPRYWQTYFEQNEAQFKILGVHTFQAFLKNPQLRENCGKTVAGQKTPWLVCEACLPKFAVDNDAARQYAQQWWQSGGKFQPPGSGAAPLSTVRMAEERQEVQRKGAFDWLLRPWRAKQLWKRILKDLADKDGQAGIDRCTELLNLMNERSIDPRPGNVYAARANYHLSLKEYKQAVEDFANAAAYYRQINDRANVYFMEDKMRLVHAIQLERETPRESGLGARLREVDNKASWLRISKYPSQEKFEALLECLDDPDPAVCAYANKLIADLPFGLKPEYEKWVAAYYRTWSSGRNKSASLAGRMLGRRLFPAPQDIYPAEIGKVKYGVPVAFVNSTCAYCGYLNLGIPLPPQGIYSGLFSKKQPEDPCHVPVICDRCNQLFYLTW